VATDLWHSGPTGPRLDESHDPEGAAPYRAVQDPPRGMVLLAAAALGLVVAWGVVTLMATTSPVVSVGWPHRDESVLTCAFSLVLPVGSSRVATLRGWAGPIP
jgi:hypothetical protein